MSRSKVKTRMTKLFIGLILFIFLTVVGLGATYALPGVVNSDRLDTYITLVNPSAVPVHIEVVVYDRGGAVFNPVVGIPGSQGQLFEYEFDLDPYETVRNARLSEITPKFIGSVFFFCDSPLAGRAEIRSTQYRDDWQNIVIELQPVDE